MPATPGPATDPRAALGRSHRQLRGRALYVLKAFGPQTEEELAARVGIRWARDLVRRHLRPLAKLGLVANSGAFGRWPPATEKTARELHRVRRRHRIPEGRVVTEVVEVGVVASVEGRDRSALEQYADDQQKYRIRRLAWPRSSSERIAQLVALPVEHVRAAIKPADAVPSVAAEMGEIYPNRRRRAIEQAIAALFRERPEYRTRRVGQVVCVVIRRLGPNFPRGQDGAPKDAGVEEILAGEAA